MGIVRVDDRTRAQRMRDQTRDAGEYARVELMGHTVVGGWALWTAGPECAGRTLQVLPMTEAADIVREYGHAAVYCVRWYGTGEDARRRMFADCGWHEEPAETPREPGAPCPRCERVECKDPDCDGLPF